MLTESENQQLIDITDTPPLEEMRVELQRSLNDATPYLAQYWRDFQTRFCLWDGQSCDGRRWQKNLGTGAKVRPWDGSSDVRTFTADDVINERVDLMMVAFQRANLQVTAIRSTDTDWSQRVTILLQWLLRNHLAEEIDREMELAANWQEGYGLAVMGIWWDQKWRLDRKKITIQEMLQKAQALAQQGNTQPLESLLDPVNDPTTVAAMVQNSPLLDRQGARKVLSDLREKGEAVVPQVMAIRNLPCMEALRPFLDVFFPSETPHFRGARWVQRRRQLPIAELEAMANRRQWDREWCEAVAAQRGKSFGALADYRELTFGDRSSQMGARGSFSRMSDHYVEVYDGYYHGIDRQTGAPALMHTTWSPLVPDLFARHEPYGYDHGEMPFVSFVRERVERAMVDSRSVPEIAGTFQTTIKTERDARNDLAQISVIPPLLVPMWRAGTEVKMGPAAQVPQKSPNELSWMAPPQQTLAGDKAEAAAELALARYFGRMHEGVMPQRTQLAQERQVGKFLRNGASCFRQMLKLCQQFMPDQQAERVVGPLRIPFQISREEIQGQFDLMLTLDASNLNQDAVLAKLKAFNEFVLSFDNQGVVDRSALAMMGAQMLDPYWAEKIVRTPEQASQAEEEDEMRNLSDIMAGIEPPMRESGQNYGLRLQVLQRLVQANPYMQQRLQSSPDSLAMLQARMKHLQVMTEQYGANRQIGRVGAAPGLEKLRADGPGGGDGKWQMANGQGAQQAGSAGGLA